MKIVKPLMTYYWNGGEYVDIYSNTTNEPVEVLNVLGWDKKDNPDSFVEKRIHDDYEENKHEYARPEYHGGK